MEHEIVLATKLRLGFSKDKMSKNNTSDWVPDLALMKNSVERNNLSFALQLVSLPFEEKKCELFAHRDLTRFSGSYTWKRTSFLFT